MAKRFKTEKEFIEVYGPGWRTEPHICFIKDMDKALGEPYDGALGIVETRYWKRQKWEISQYLLTDKPLLPIGTKVAIPNTKSFGDNINESVIINSGKKQGYLYYIGVFNSHHCLNDTIIGDGGDYFTASEILEAYQRYNKENSPNSEFKVGDYVVNILKSWNSTITENSYKFDKLNWIGKIIDVGFSDTVNLPAYKIEVEPGKFCGKAHYQIRLATQEEIDNSIWSKSIWSDSRSKESLLEEAKRRYPVGTKFECLHNCTGGPINDLSEIQLDTDGCIRWRGQNAGCLYEESKWAEIIEPDCIAKAGECGTITDFGRSSGSSFILNKPYLLSEDLNKNSGFIACSDDYSISNGWDIGQISNNLNFKQNETKQDEQRQNGNTIKTNRKTTAITTEQGYAGNPVSSPKRQPKITVGYIGN